MGAARVVLGLRRCAGDNSGTTEEAARTVRQHRYPGLTPNKEGLMQESIPGLPAVDPQARPDRHWFVNDGAGYCRACGLPAANGRHVPRKAATR